MGFALPAMLGVIPLGVAGLIYLHMRAQSSEKFPTWFPAFLDPATPTTVQLDRRIRYRALLATRIAILTLVSIGLAQPYTTVETVATGGTSIIVDGSFSMQRMAADGSQTLLEQALELASKTSGGGATVQVCADRLRSAEFGASDGSMQLERCLSQLPSQQAWLITDGYGAEMATLPAWLTVSVLEDGTAADSAQADRALDEMPLSLQRNLSDDLTVNNRQPNPISVRVNSAAANASQCMGGSICGLPTSTQALHVTFDQTGVSLFNQTFQFDGPLRTLLPVAANSRKITVVSQAAQSALYSDHHLLMEAMLAFRDAHPEYSVVFARTPDQVQQDGILIYRWDQLDDDVWMPWIDSGAAGNAVWLIPGVHLADVLVPKPLPAPFGTYRGWLQRDSSLKWSDLGAASAGSWQGTPVDYRQKISIGETGAAEIVLHDKQGEPVIIGWPGKQPHVLFLIGLDSRHTDVALHPDFLPALSWLADNWGRRADTAANCVANRRLPSDSEEADRYCGPRVSLNLTGQSVVHDWRDLAPRRWATERQGTDTVEQRITYGAAIAAVTGLLTVIGAAIGAVSGWPWLAVFVLISAMGLPLGSEVAMAQQADDQTVAYLDALRPDQARTGGFKLLNQQLAARANIRVTQLDAWSSRAGNRPTAFVWTNLCQSTTESMEAVVAQGIDAIEQGAVWWIEDCAQPGDTTLGFRALTRALANSDIGARWKRVTSNHVLFKSYYLLNRLEGRYGAGSEKVIGSSGMPVILYTPQDLTGKVAFGGANEQVYRSFVNIAFYLTMGDYKEDGIHLPYLLKRLKRSGK